MAWFERRVGYSRFRPLRPNDLNQDQVTVGPSVYVHISPQLRLANAITNEALKQNAIKLANGRRWHKVAFYETREHGQTMVKKVIGERRRRETTIRRVR